MTNDIATLKPIPPRTTDEALRVALNVDARRALRDHVIVYAGDIAIVPDTIVLELEANGIDWPDTTALGWSDDDPTVAGRLCLLFRVRP